MKQYTNETQTAKLIELGFEKPKALADAEPSSGVWVRPAYSIGELIEMLPTILPNYGGCNLDFTNNGESWFVHYDMPAAKPTAPLYCTSQTELIDALYDMIIKLKEEKKI